MRKKNRDNAAGTRTVKVEERFNAKNPKVVHEEASEWILESREFPVEKPPSHLEMSLGLTKSLGKYQSARMDLSVRVPCYPEEFETYYERMRKWLTTRLSKEVKKINDGFADSGRI